MGILGKNGAGKSTLLQIIAGTLKPSDGEVRTDGPISALLELGSGFNPEFTGKENVLLSAQIMGLSVKQALEKFDDIATFADIGDFINQPVKTYSSGMMVRLAFGVQTAFEPKILIVDEALAVGDMFFQTKCMARIKKLVDDGVSLLFVSHDPGTVRQLCSRALLLDQGEMVAFGDAKSVADTYSSIQLDERNKEAKKSIEGKKRQMETASIPLASSKILATEPDITHDTRASDDVQSSHKSEPKAALEDKNYELADDADVSSYQKNVDSETKNSQRMRKVELGIQEFPRWPVGRRIKDECVLVTNDREKYRENFVARLSGDKRVGNSDAVFYNVLMFNSDGVLATQFEFDEEVVVRIYVAMRVTLRRLNLSIQIRNRQGLGLLFYDLRVQNKMDVEYHAGHIYRFDWRLTLNLMCEHYHLNTMLAHPPATPGDDWVFLDNVHNALDFSITPNPDFPVSSYLVPDAEVSIFKEEL